MPKIYETEEFESKVRKLSPSYQRQISSIKNRLSNDFNVGKILRFPFLREKRIREHRIYYLIYEDLDSVLLVAISNKKTQQETIDRITRYLPEYNKLMRELSDSFDSASL